MPRANGKDAFYFPHDSNARMDNKILDMRAKYGAEGYGLYWMLVEILREQPEYKYPLGKFSFRSLAMQMNCDSGLLEGCIVDCCTEFVDENSSLLSMDDNYLWSASLLRRMKVVDEVSEVRKSAAEKRWKSKSNANALQSKCKKTSKNGSPTLSGVSKKPELGEVDEKRPENPGSDCGPAGYANALQMISKEKNSIEEKSIEKERKGEERKENARAAARDAVLSCPNLDETLRASSEIIGREPTQADKERFARYWELLGPERSADVVNEALSRGVKEWFVVVSAMSIEAISEEARRRGQ